MIRTLIVDDEPIARRGIRGLLKGEVDVEIVGEAGDGVQALEEIESKHPDLVFLDVQMPGLDGFEVVEEIGATRMPAVVFVTAFDEFALRAFSVHALDYLLKPVKKDQFRAAVDRARAVLEFSRRKDLGRRLDGLVAEINSGKKFVERFLLRSAGRLTIVRVDDIDWLESDGDYVRVHAHGKKNLLRIRISEIESKLNPAQFIRIHRSTIVAIDRVVEMKPATNGDYLVRLTDGTQLNLSRTYRERVFAHLQH